MSFVSRFEKYSYDLYGWVRLPEVNITNEEKASVGLKPDATDFEFLRHLVYKGFKEKVSFKKGNSLFSTR